MSWKICTIAAASQKNWALGRDNGVWGIPSEARKVDPNRAKKGDRLLFWLAKSGYVGYATVTEDARRPLTREEVPWAGGLYSWGIIVPMSVDFECPTPVWIAFSEGKQLHTGIPQFALQRGFTNITDEAASAALKAIHGGEPA